MSLRYPVLDNRPIDQWKVTELKDELRRRKLTIKGLKEDLIKRLDEALCIERENNEKANGLGSNSELEAMVENEKAVLDVADLANELLDERGVENKIVDNIPVTIDINDCIAVSVPLDTQAGVIHDGNDSFREEVLLVSNMETSVVATETVVTEVDLSEQGCKYIETKGEDRNLVVSSEHDVHNIETEGDDRNLQHQPTDEEIENEDLKHHLGNNALNSPQEDLMHDSSSPNNQVLEVNPPTGSMVTSDSMTTETVTINETIELRDNISSENVKLELDVELEMVEPSSITVVAAGGESHLMDVEEPCETPAFVGEKDDCSGTLAEMSKKMEVADGYSEKLNLDKSSGDDSMEEDVLESKQVESKCNPDEVEDTSEKSAVTVIKLETYDSIIRKESYSELRDRKDSNVEKKDHSALLAEKRKLPDHAAVGNEPGKRQRRWNTESIKVPVSKCPNITSSPTPKDTSLSTDVKQFFRSNSTVSEGAAKDRVVPPSSKPSSNSLRIDNFLRPFTLKAVQELLGKTGSVTSFWMDHIKTHCLATFKTVEEAEETRNAVYNLQWPPNGGRLLAAEFVDPQEVEKRAEVPQPPTPTTISAPIVAPALPILHPEPLPQLPRQKLPPPPSLPPPPPVKDQLPLPPPPPIIDKIEPPIITLDDLFRKTKATPRIYYLPLSENQVATKLAAEGKGTQI